MSYRILAFSMLLCTATVTTAQVSLFISEPHVSIGINLPVYPELVRVPNYPVYYAPRADANIFFYDGLYWVYHDDRWYASTWYNGPWGEVAPTAVPLYVLRVPVRYYRQPPAYFKAWAADAPPRWDVHWGSTWAQQRAGWDRWNRSSAPAPAPLPMYQREYSGGRYPATLEQQQVLQSRQYRYQPRETVVQQYYRQQALPPGQAKKAQGAHSAKEFAPGQVKKEQGAQSAKEYAPGQVKKNQGAQPSQGGEAVEADEGHGKGQGHGKGKGHGKD